ncbi:MAG: hypothetical protein ABMA25_09280, partial [Ilumatobacteraceae bacterium]
MDNNELDTASTPEQAVADSLPSSSTDTAGRAEATGDAAAATTDGATTDGATAEADGADGMEGLDDPTVRTAARPCR